MNTLFRKGQPGVTGTTGVLGVFEYLEGKRTLPLWLFCSFSANLVSEHQKQRKYQTKDKSLQAPGHYPRIPLSLSMRRFLKRALYSKKKILSNIFQKIHLRQRLSFPQKKMQNRIQKRIHDFTMQRK